MSARRPLSADDARILRLESGAIAGHTIKLVTLAAADGDPLTASAVRQRIAERVRHIDPLCKTLHESSTELCWEPDERFDPANHVGEITPPEPLDGAGLNAVVAEAFAERLDRSQPLWRVDVVQPLAGGGTALLFRIHHALADGSTAMRWIAALLGDDVDDAGKAAKAPVSGHLKPPKEPEKLPRWARRTQADLATRVLGMPRLVPALTRELFPPGRRLPLAAPASGARRVAVVTRQLDELKRIEHRAGDHVTVNDVLLAAIAGGLRRWMEQRSLPPRDVRVQVPVSMHARDEDLASATANLDSFLLITLPIREPDPVARLRRINAATRSRKRHHDAQLMYLLFGDLSRVPVVGGLSARAIESPRAYAFAVSNMRGPRGLERVLGREVTGLSTFAEIGQGHALRVAAVSHAGRVAISLVADRVALDDLDVLAAGVDGEVDALLSRVG